jgi:predicted RecB family nuclease
MAETVVTGSLLYNLVSCPRRVTLDLFGDPNLRDPISPFVQMLWARGNLFEQQTIAALDIPFLDLSKAKKEDKERLTLEAMQCGEPLIYSGRISAGDLLGIPDLLRKSGHCYVPGDIKSGSGKEGGGEDEHDGKPKITYAVQLALYLDVLERLGFSAGRNADRPPLSGPVGMLV